MVKLTHVINFTSILRAAVAPIFFCQKLQSKIVREEKLKKHFCTKKVAHTYNAGKIDTWIFPSRAAAKVYIQAIYHALGK